MAAEFPIQSDVTKTSGRRSPEKEDSVPSQIREGMREYLTRGKERVMEMEEGLEGYVQEHPIRSILIAAGAGIVIGALISRR